MKNLFDYATKELLQDAFLRWLFENYDCENEKICKACGKLLSAFTNLDDFRVEKVTDLKTLAQWKKIDVLIDFKYEDKVFCIAIEDKVFSEEHTDQLNRYKNDLKEYLNELKKIHKCTEINLKKIYYKTGKLSDSETDRIREPGWVVFDIEKIKGLFDNLKPTGSEVFDSYIDHVLNIYKQFYSYDTIPLKDWSKNYIPFTAYSYGLFERYSDSIDKKDCRTQIYHGKYAETFIQKNLSNGITVELVFLFRDWGCAALIKTWDTTSGYRILCKRTEGIRRLCAKNINICWNNKQLKNRIKIAKKEITVETPYVAFNAWIEDCVKDYLDYAQKIESVPK